MNDSKDGGFPLGERFGFGSNWSTFVDKRYSDDKLDSSVEAFRKFTKLDSLSGYDFLDIGCGSGLHSLSASKLNARKITSFDFDPNSVDATSKIKELNSERAGNWEIFEGSVLDSEFVSSLGKHNFVYSWGVLHHTGNVWLALKNAASTVSDGGYFYIALYSLDVQPNPDFWLGIKKRYVSSGNIIKRFLEFWYLFRYVLGSSVINLIKYPFSRERRFRGMDLMTDIRDWLGGWPMEFVWDAEVIEYLKKLNFNLLEIKTGEACTEFLFIKQ